MAAGKKSKTKVVEVLAGSDLISQVTDDSEYTKAAVKNVIDDFLSKLRAHLVAGNTVTLKGIGSFGTKVRAARTGRNPITGESLQIPDVNVIRFKPSITMKKEANGK